MPLFKVKVRSVITYESSIVVAAQDEAEARRYLHQTHDWKNDTSLHIHEAGTCNDVKIPVELNEIHCIGEAPRGWDGRTIPWNSQKKLAELLTQ
jgi:hypothetical protein